MKHVNTCINAFCIACVITTTTMISSIFLQTCNHIIIIIIIITVSDPYRASVESYLQARMKQRRYPLAFLCTCVTLALQYLNGKKSTGCIVLPEGKTDRGCHLASAALRSRQIARSALSQVSQLRRDLSWRVMSLFSECNNSLQTKVALEPIVQ